MPRSSFPYCLSMDRRLLVFLLLLGKSACNVSALQCCIRLNCDNRQTHTGFLAAIAAAKSRHGHSRHHHGKKVTRPRAPKPKQPGPGRPGPPRPRKNHFTCACVRADAALSMWLGFPQHLQLKQTSPPIAFDKATGFRTSHAKKMAASLRCSALAGAAGCASAWTPRPGTG